MPSLTPLGRRDTARASSLVIALASLLLTSGCLSLVLGNRARVRIETEPAGAEVVSVTGDRCTTPCELTVPKLKIQALWIEKEGFVPVEVPLATRTWRTGIVASVGVNLALGAAMAAAGAAFLYWAETNDDIAAGLGLLLGAPVVGLGGGVASDFFAGAHRKLESDHVRVVLQPAKETPADEFE